MCIISEQAVSHLKAWLCLALAGSTIFSFSIPCTSALTIIRRYVPPRKHFEFHGMKVMAGQPPTNSIGGGNLVEIFDAAADSWERAIKDDHTVTIQFGWFPIPLGGGVHHVRFQSGMPNRVTEAIVYFDNDGSTVWFLDPTHRGYSEYPTTIECYATLGKKRVNSGHMLSGNVGSPQALDLLTIAKHEIGHSIALSTGNDLWVSKQTDQGIHVTAPRPFPETLIPIDAGGHLGLHEAVMDVSLLPNQRKLISVLDVRAIAEMGEFIDLNLHSEDSPRGASRPGHPGQEKAGTGCT